MNVGALAPTGTSRIYTCIYLHMYRRINILGMGGEWEGDAGRRVDGSGADAFFYVFGFRHALVNGLHLRESILFRRLDTKPAAGSPTQRTQYEW